MSLNAIHVHVMVFSDTKEKAYEYMKNLVHSSEEVIVRESNLIIVTETKIYEAARFSPHLRGHRYREVHIDKCLLGDDEILNLMTIKLVPPHYYVGIEKDENYNWKDHVHYFES